MVLTDDILNCVTIGQAQTYQNLTMIPICGNSLGEPDYLLLDEAIKAGTASVTENSQSGSVPELIFKNDGDKAVLLLDGEELIGAKQNRILNVTIFAAPNSITKLPVSCVEAGRWNYKSREFSTSNQVQFSKARAQKNKRVYDNMQNNGSRAANQGEVWNEIEVMACKMGVSSPTSAMSDIYESYEDQIKAFSDNVKPIDNQLGAIFAINGEIIGLDLFDFNTTFTKILPKLVRSYALDAIDSKNGPKLNLDDSSAENFIGKIKAAEWKAFESVGEGVEYRYQNSSFTASKLAARKRIVHMSAFNLEEPKKASVVPAYISRPSTRRKLY